MEQIINLSQDEIKKIFDSMTPEELEHMLDKLNEMKNLLKENLGVQ